MTDLYNAVKRYVLLHNQARAIRMAALDNREEQRAASQEIYQSMPHSEMPEFASIELNGSTYGVHIDIDGDHGHTVIEYTPLAPPDTSMDDPFHGLEED